ncbi:MAG: hypothetical protein P8J32_04270 [bacterium]|nr:hypothetical protein [bacterium]
MNKSPEFDGQISEETGLFACIIFHEMDKTNKAILFDGPHGMCEMHEPKEEL